MSTICPHCRTYRPHDASTPAWQCPACEKAYAKSGDGRAATSPVAPARAASRGYERDGVLSDLPWLKILICAAVVIGGWYGYQQSLKSPNATPGVTSREGRLRSGPAGGGSNPTTEQLKQLAAASSAGDVLMFSASWCPNCSAARSWMAEYGFKHEICDIEASPACKSQLLSLDPQGGIPYLIVKGQHMKDGFDGEQFIGILKQ
jgi:glutaredoxin